MAFNNIYNGKKVLITGNTGFKGSWLSTWLTMHGRMVFMRMIQLLEANTV